ncbi:MAG: Rrf2 family transcriptional regulator [Bdellovibrionota bacterium]
MVKLSRKIEYALISLKALSQKNSGNLTSAKEISNMYGAPFDVVSRVLQTLNQAGIVKSIQGVQGGYHLLKNLEDITFHELIEVIEGPLALVKCIHDNDACEMAKSCNIISPVALLNDKINEFYKTIKISDLIINPSLVKFESKLEETSDVEAQRI